MGYDPKNKQFALCDEQLLKVFGVKRFRTFSMMKYLKTHLPIEEVLRTRRGIKRWFAHCGRVYFFFHFFFLYFFKFCFAEESFYDFLLLVSKVESNAKCQLLNIGALYS